MSYEQANQILDAIRAGLGGHYTIGQIRFALRLTGDIE